MKIKNREQTRNRVRIYRGIQSIMKQDTVSLVNTAQLRKQMFKNSSKSNEEAKPPKLSDKMRSWAIEFHIKRRALTALLKLLRSFGMQSLPQDGRCLLKTPRFIEIEARAGGKYWHNGLQKTLSRAFSKLNSDLHIQINLNIDGLPLFKSSPKSFWPILATVHGM